MDIDARRKELITELNEFQSQDRFINDTKKTIDDLNQERDGHTEIIQQINQDRSDLEKIMNGAREEQKTLESKLTQSYEQIYQMLEQINRLSKESGLTSDELLDPNTLLPQLSSLM
jgi:chromosome segregation ATPase